MRKITPGASGIVPMVFALVLSGCASVTITPNDQKKVESVPTYQDNVDFFVFGLTPKAQEVNPYEMCDDQDVRQMQTHTTFVNGLMTIVTLGIYAPRTVRVWCEEG